MKVSAYSAIIWRVALIGAVLGGAVGFFPPTSAVAGFGAVAFDETTGTKYGFGRDEETQQRADETALRACSAPGGEDHCGFYVNKDGHQVPRPCGDWRTEPPPPTAAARCRDGTYSYSENRRGTCSGHYGVESWLDRPRMHTYEGDMAASIDDTRERERLPSYGGDQGCKIVFRVPPGRCAAFATAEKGSAWGGSVDDARANAQLRALESCQKHTSGKCVLRGSDCIP